MFKNLHERDQRINHNIKMDGQTGSEKVKWIKVALTGSNKASLRELLCNFLFSFITSSLVLPKSYCSLVYGSATESKLPQTLLTVREFALPIAPFKPSGCSRLETLIVKSRKPPLYLHINSLRCIYFTKVGCATQAPDTRSCISYPLLQ
jgi:hypothetical protein